ncbi:MAG TPA: glycosyltransferase family 39 protein [Granulicella sp.]
MAFLISTIVKLLSLNSREPWLDETYSAYAASLPFSELIRFTAGDVHPRLFSVALWTWVQMTGESPSHLRLFSVLINILCVLVMFFFSRRVLGTRAGALAATLFAFSPTLFVYSLEIRSYMLFHLVLVSLLYLHWITQVEQRRSWPLTLGYSVAGALLIYIHYLGILVLFALFVHGVMLSWKQRSAFVRVLGAYALIAILFLPGLPLLLKQRSEKQLIDQQLRLSRNNPQALSAATSTTSTSTRKPAPLSVLQNIAALAGVYPSRSRVLLVLLAIPIAAASGTAVFLWLVPGNPVCVMGGTVGLVFLVLVIMGGFENHRYYLPLVPLFILMLTRAAWYWSDRFHSAPLSMAMPMALLLIYLAGFYRQATMPHGQPWTNLVNALRSRSSSDDEVVFEALYAQVPFDYFAHLQGFQIHETGFPVSIYKWWDEQPHKAWAGPVLLKSDLDNMARSLETGTAHTTWIVSYETQNYDPHQALLKRLGQDGPVAEITLPPDPDDHDVTGPSLRLFRFSPASTYTPQKPQYGATP